MSQYPSMEQVSSELSTARQFAALSGPFDPVQALQAIGTDPATLGADKLTLISAGLAEACDRTFVGDSERWLMRRSERRHELDEISGHADTDRSVAEAIAWRQQLATDPATDDLLAALLGEGLFSDAGLDALLRREPAEMTTLQRVGEALERAGPLAPQFARLADVRAALTRAGLRANLKSVVERGFFGREQELAQTRAWAQARPDQTMRALYVQGLPGIGKSTLLEETASSLVGDSSEWIVVRLDFDRAGLDIQDLQGLTLELARQVAGQLENGGAELLRAREQVLRAATVEDFLKGSSRQFVPPVIGRAIADALAREHRRLLVLLDTLEVLRGRGETQPARLFAWLDELVAFGPFPAAVIAAGRGDAMGSAPERMAGQPVDLAGLDDTSADQLLASLGVAQPDFAHLRTITGNNPLALRLAAKIAVEDGAEALKAAAGQDGFAAAHLYRFLLSRIDDEDLRRLANPGLVVRVIDPHVIREVLAPAVGLRTVTTDRAQTLFDELASHHWLVQPDPIAPGFVRHRPDMRAVLLPLLYQSAPGKCAKIDRSAARWFARRPEPWAPIEAAYHRLQLMRRDKRVPALDPGTLGQLDQLTIEELPQVAQDVVLRSRGERTTSYRGHDVDQNVSLDPYAAQELRSIIDRGDWVEGGYYYDRAFRHAVFDARSEEADAARTFLWRSGQWSEALRLLGERDDQGADDSDLPRLAERFPQDAACRLEMRAELQFDDLVESLGGRETEPATAAYLVSQGLRSSLGSGALRLVLEVVGDYERVSPQQLDPARAAALWWKRGAQTGTEPAGNVDQSLPEEGAGWSRISARIGADQPRVEGAVGKARALAALSPFGELVATMTASGNRPAALAFVDQACKRVGELGLLAPQGSRGWHDVAPFASPSGGLNTLTDVGLLAEAIGAAGYVLRDADLNLVAKSAERWRRTMAGTWSYGARPASRPPGWDLPVDVSITDRIARLRKARDPVARAQRELDAWCDPELDLGAPFDLVRARAPSVVKRAAAAKGPEEAARLLLARYVPSAFVPALVVLLEQSGAPDKRDRPTRRSRPR